MLRRYLQSLFILSILILSLILNSCSEKEPTSPDKEHFKAYGFILESSGATQMKVFRGQIDPQFKQYIEVTAGAITDHLEIIFLDEEGKKLDPPKDSDYSFGWNIADTTIAKIHRHGVEWEFHIVGIKPGETNIELLVLHNDHPDFRSPKIPIKVIASDISTPVSFKIIEEDTKEVLVSFTKDGSIEGEIKLEYPNRTEHLIIEFYDENDNKIAIPSPPFNLKLKFSDNTIVEADIEYWEFNLKPLKYGTTSFRVIICENNEDKYVFMGEILVTVE